MSRPAFLVLFAPEQRSAIRCRLERHTQSGVWFTIPAMVLTNAAMGLVPEGLVEGGDECLDDDRIDEDYCDQPRYRSVAEIGPSDLVEALKSLAGFAENPVLVMQAGQLCMIDNLLNALEDEVMRRQANDDPPRDKVALLGALSPMWIYAAYELQRTWRQRCEEVIKLAESGGLDFKAVHLERELGYRHYDRELRAEQLRNAQQRPELVAQMRIDLRRTEMGFTTLEFIRVALAKHEVSKKGSKKPIAFAPGMARRNRYCGSMEY